MKKFVSAIVFTLLAFSFGYAATTTGDTVVTASVKGQLELTNLLASLDLGEIDSGASDTGDITFSIRSNQKSWTVSAKSTYGSHLVYGGKTAWTTADTTVFVPYKVTFKEADNDVLGTANTSLTASDSVLYTFDRKTVGGSTPEAFKLTVDVAADTEDHVVGFYKDTITITIAAL